MTDEEFLPVIFKNIDELRFRLVRILEVFGFFFIFFLIFSITRVTLFGVSFPFITFDVYHNIPAQFLKLLEAHIVPSGTQLLVLKPTDGVSANIYTALFLSLIFAMPKAHHIQKKERYEAHHSHGGFGSKTNIEIVKYGEEFRSHEPEAHKCACCK